MCSININELREIYFADGKITKEELQDLFAKYTEAGETSSSEDDFFAECVVAWALADDTFDAEEAQFLIDEFMKDGTISDFESAAITEMFDACDERNIQVPTIFIEAFSEFLPEEEEEEDEVEE